MPASIANGCAAAKAASRLLRRLAVRRRRHASRLPRDRAGASRARPEKCDRGRRAVDARRRLTGTVVWSDVVSRPQRRPRRLCRAPDVTPPARFPRLERRAGARPSSPDPATARRDRRRRRVPAQRIDRRRESRRCPCQVPFHDVSRSHGVVDARVMRADGRRVRSALLPRSAARSANRSSCRSIAAPFEFGTLPFVNTASCFAAMPVPVPRILGHADDWACSRWRISAT